MTGFVNEFRKKQANDLLDARTVYQFNTNNQPLSAWSWVGSPSLENIDRSRTLCESEFINIQEIDFLLGKAFAAVKALINSPR